MSRMDDIHDTLRSLDPADRHVDPAGARARADLRAILAIDPAPPRQHPAAPAPAVAARPRRGARNARRVALAGALVAAVVAGAVVLPPRAGGDQALATWTATPGDLSGQEVPEAAADCRKSQKDGMEEYADDLDGAEAVIAERRGVWLTVVLAGADGFSALCVTDDSARLFSGGMIGSLGTYLRYTAPGPRELTATSLGVGAMDAGEISLAAGAAGADVVGVVYSSHAHGKVAATVSGGHFALWLPGDEFEDTASDGVALEVTYRDGTTATDRLFL